MQAHIDLGNGFLKVPCPVRDCARDLGRRRWNSGDITIVTAGKPYTDANKRQLAGYPGVLRHWRQLPKVPIAFRLYARNMGACRKGRSNSARPGQILDAEEALANSKSPITIKRHLLRAGIIVNRCDWCGLSAWRGRPLSIQIDHINGIRDDHRVENLRMLCPNCHSQTETFAGNNIKSNGSPGSSNGRTAASEVAYRGSSP